MSRRKFAIAAATVCAVTLSSCSGLNVNQLPQPGHTYAGGNDILIEFDNVLNLPDRARVVLDGTTVGVVAKIEPTSQYVGVTVRIDNHVAIPSNIHAALQQATVLGDIYVALERPTEPAPDGVHTLSSGDSIPLAQTTTPPPLEATIANLANFVSSGSIQRIQNTMIHLNAIQPEGGEPALRQLVSQVSADIKDLGRNMDTVDHWLNGLSQTGQLMYDSIPSFEQWFSTRGMNGFERGMAIIGRFATILPTLSSVFAGGYWLKPLLLSMADALGALQQSKWAFEDEYPAWQNFLNNYFLPQDKHPAINITSIVAPDGRELSGNVQDVLRILGAAP